MSRDSANFEINKYINSNLENDELKSKVIINLDEDTNHEPYIEITYITEDGEKAGLIQNYENLNKVKCFANKYKSVLEQYIGDYIIPVLYDPQTSKLNLIKRQNNSYVGNKFRDDQPEAFFVGFIYNNDVGNSFSGKIDHFSKIIAKIMLNQHEDNVGDLIFKVKNKELQNSKYIKLWNAGYQEFGEIDTQESIRTSNEKMIKTEFQLGLTK